MEEPRPDVKLIDCNGNAFYIISKCKKAMKKAGCSRVHINKFVEECTSGDYDNLLRTAMKYCVVC